MKKLLLSTSFFLTTVLFATNLNAQNKTYFTESFETFNSDAGGSGVTTETGFWNATTYPSEPADSLKWIFKYTGTSNSSSDVCTPEVRAIRVRKSENGYAITPVLSQGVNKITFTDGRGKPIGIYTSKDKGATWTFLESKANTQCVQSEVTINDATVNRIKFQNDGTAGDVGLDNIKITSVNDIPLPLDFLSFTAKADAFGKTVALNWSTTNEINTKNFDIQKRTEDADFATIGTLASKNISGIHHYSFSDNSASAGNSYYRIVQFDNDGASTLSKIQVVSTKASASLSIYPNPTSSTLTVNHAIAQAGASVKVISMNGKTVLQQELSLNSTSTQLDVSNLNSGSYLLMLSTQDQKSSLKFIKK